jgi:DNA-binding MarR family transcriptional regulator
MGERTVSDREKSRGVAARGVLREIDQQLNRLDKEEKALSDERQQLLAARAALAGKAAAGPARGKRISQDDIAAYLTENPGSLPAQVAEALGVPVTNVSTHLYRLKDKRFARRADGWHVLSGAVG